MRRSRQKRALPAATTDTLYLSNHLVSLRQKGIDGSSLARSNRQRIRRMCNMRYSGNRHRPSEYWIYRDSFIPITPGGVSMNCRLIRPSMAMLVGAAVLMLSSAYADAAHAANANASLLPSVTCTLGWDTTEFSPPLRLANEDTTVTAQGSVNGCLPNTYGISRATYTVQAAGNINCLDGGQAGGSFAFTWFDAQNNVIGVSTASYGPGSGSFQLRLDGASIVVVKGTVQSGLFAGGNMTFQTDVVNLDVTACLRDTGVGSLAGPVTEVTFSSPL